jgi:hypothetical protein
MQRLKNREALVAALLPGDPQWHGASDDAETVPGSSKPNPCNYVTVQVT